ncbi:MAG: FkbM family methyltransferase [Thermaurantiacus sp.]
MATIRQTAKRWVPAALHRPLRRLEAYGRRLRIWQTAIRETRGATPADQAIIRRSFLVSPIVSARDLDRWQDPMLLADADVEVTGFGRFHVRGNSDDFWHVLPSREPAIVETVRQLVGPGDTFVDAGANIGFYSVQAARRAGEHGHVIAVEMMPDTADILRAQVQRNRLANVRVVEAALSDTEGDEVLAHVSSGRYGQASLVAHAADAKSVRVTTTTLAQLLADVPRVALMKMDLEGAELSALVGGRPALPRIEAIIFEAHTRAGEVAMFLAEAGFAVRELDRRNALATRRSDT